MSGLLLLMLSISIVGVSAYIYQQSSKTIDQTIVEITSITLKNSDLGNINEGQTKRYTSAVPTLIGWIVVPELGDAITITTTASNVYLHLDSDLDSLTDYSTYEITVKFSQVVGSTYSVGDTACILDLASPDYSSIDLDAAGTWKFRFTVITTADSVDANSDTTATIIVKAESTS